MNSLRGLQCPPIVERVHQYVETHYAEGISLRDVAAALAYSAAHLTYLYRLSTGKPINAWIIERRILAATQLLDATEMPIGEVCDAVGFGDLSYFSRQFQRYCGTTPGRYRMNLRKAA